MCGGICEYFVERDVDAGKIDIFGLCIKVLSGVRNPFNTGEIEFSFVVHDSLFLFITPLPPRRPNPLQFGQIDRIAGARRLQNTEDNFHRLDIVTAAADRLVPPEVNELRMERLADSLLVRDATVRLQWTFVVEGESQLFPRRPTDRRLAASNSADRT